MGFIGNSIFSESLDRYKAYSEEKTMLLEIKALTLATDLYVKMIDMIKYVKYTDKMLITPKRFTYS